MGRAKPKSQRERTWEEGALGSGWGGERDAGLPSVLQTPAVSKTEGQGPGVTQPGNDAL